LLTNQLKERIYAEMEFTFTIKDEVGGLLKTIQATINYIEFQFPSNNEENYLVRRRFGWFHEELEVAFGIVDKQATTLDAKSRKVLDSSKVEEGSSQGTSKEIARIYTNAYKAKVAFKHGVIANVEYNKTNGSEAKTTDEIQNSWKTIEQLQRETFHFLIIQICILNNSNMYFVLALHSKRMSLRH